MSEHATGSSSMSAGSSTDEYDDYDGLGLAELVAKGETTPSELVEHAIRRIEQRNPPLNAVITPLFDRAREAARGTLPDGPFRGVPMLIKDLHSALAGEPLESGSRLFRGFVPRANSALVDRYIASGAIICGKTNTPELGLQPTTEPASKGPSRNPWDTGRTPGGSSGGSGAAVAARMVPLAGGGDGGGSIRIPSSCCGLFGMKPTRGRTPTGPEAAEAWNGFAIEHVLTRSVRDSAAMLDVVSGWLPGDMHYLPDSPERFADAVAVEPGPLRIAVSTAPYLPSKVDGEVVAAIDEVARLLADLGHEIVDEAPRIDGARFARAFLTVVCGQTAAAIRRGEEDVGRPAGDDDLETKTRLAALSGEAFSAADYVSAVAVLHEQARRVHRFMADVDVIVNPVVAAPPPELGFLESKGPMAAVERLAVRLGKRLPVGRLLTVGPLLDQVAADTYSFIPWTPVYNVTGQPSMSVPLSWSRQGLPIGTMFTGRFAAEHTLYALAGQLERARPWADRRPPLRG